MEYKVCRSDELTHWGIKGMRWGIRRYQRKDGSLTPAGKKRLQKESAALKKEAEVLKNRKATKAKFDRLAAKRKAIEDEKLELEGKKKPSKNDPKSESSTQKSVKNMTDDELREHTNRMQLESNYYNAQKNLATANPKQVSKGKKFMNGLLNDVVAPAAKNVGKMYLENLLKDKLGLKEQSKMSVDDMAKKFKLDQDRKNEKLEDVRREIALLKAEESLRQERARLKKDDDE